MLRRSAASHSRCTCNTTRTLRLYSFALAAFVNACCFLAATTVALRLRARPNRSRTLRCSAAHTATCACKVLRSHSDVQNEAADHFAGSISSLERMKKPRVTSASRVARIRLETLDGFCVRIVLIAAYATVMLAGIVTYAIGWSGEGSASLDVLLLQPCGNRSVVEALPSASGCAIFADNSTAFHGQITDLTALDGDAALQLVPTADGPKPVSLPFVFSATLSAVQPDGRIEELVKQVNASAELVCSQGSGDGVFACSPIPLLSTASITGGAGAGGFPAYQFTVLLPFASNLLSNTSALRFTYQEAGYRISDTVIRLVLLVSVMTVAAAYIRTLLPLRQHTLNVQRQIALMLLLIILWTNPVYIGAELITAPDFAQSQQQLAIFRLCCVCLEQLGWSMLFALWWTLADQKLSSSEVEALAADPRFMRFIMRQEPRPRGCCPWICGPGAYVGNVEIYRKAHYRKMLLAAGLFVSGSCTQMLARPALFTAALGSDSFTLFDGPDSAQQLLLIVVICGAIYCLLLLLWLVSIGLACRSSTRQLRQVPYAPTRALQLGFRLYVWMGSLITIFVVGTNVAPLAAFAVSLSAGAAVSSSEVSVEARVTSLLAIVSSQAAAATPIGELLLVTVYTIILAYCYAPAPQFVALMRRAKAQDTLTSVASALALPAAIAMQAGGSLLQTARHALGAQPAEQPVPIALLCAMYDMSVLAYYDLPGAPRTPSAFGVLPAIPHGFVAEGSVYDPVMDTCAITLRNEHRVVVAFRGTCSGTNLRSDLSFMPRSAEFGDHHSAAADVPALRQALPLCHSGFWGSYAPLREQLSATVRTALANAGPSAKLYCTGHSLGGALATLAACDMAGLVAANRQAHLSLRRGPTSWALRWKLPAQNQPLLRPSPGSQEDEVSTDYGINAGQHSVAPVVISLVSTPSTRVPPGDGVAADDAGDGAAVSPATVLEMQLADEADGGAQTDPLDCLGSSPQQEPWELADDEDDGPADCTCITFGSPRVGNRAFASLFHRRVRAWRVTMDGDLVTGVPRAIFGGYTHVGIHLLLDADGNALVSPSVIEKTFRARARYSFNAHRMGSYRAALTLLRRTAGSDVVSDTH